MCAYNTCKLAFRFLKGNTARQTYYGGFAYVKICMSCMLVCDVTEELECIRNTTWHHSKHNIHKPHHHIPYFTCCSYGIKAILISFKALIYFATGAWASFWKSSSGHAETEYFHTLPLTLCLNIWNTSQLRKQRLALTKQLNISTRHQLSSKWASLLTALTSKMGRREPF